MASLFPAHRPSVGISFGSSAIRHITVRRVPLRCPRITKVNERPLSEGVLAPSMDGPHLSDRDAVVKELGQLFDGGGRTVAVSLPDEVASLRVLSFEQLPQDQGERDALVRWRLQRDMNLATECPRVLYRVYGGEPLSYVLAGAVHETILAQYEAVWDAVGLVPMSVGCETLQILDFVRPLFIHGSDYCFVHRSSTALMFFGVRDGIPIFFRRLGLRSEFAESIEDIIGTLQYLEDSFPRAGGNEALRLYWVDTAERTFPDPHPFLLPVPVASRVTQISVVPIPWQEQCGMSSVMPISERYLPAVACVGVA